MTVKLKDKITFEATAAPTTPGDIGVDATTGRVSYHDGAMVQTLANTNEISGGVNGSLLHWGCGRVADGAVPAAAAGTFFLPPFGNVSGVGFTIAGFGPFPVPPPLSGGNVNVGLIMPGSGFIRRMVVDPTFPGTPDGVTIQLLKFPGEVVATVVGGPPVGPMIGPLVAFPFALGDIFQVAWTQPLRAVASKNIHVTVYAEFTGPV